MSLALVTEIDIGGLVFDQRFQARINRLDGWWDGPTPQPLMAQAGGVGAAATGPWLAKERYVTAVGRFRDTDPVQARRALLGRFSADRDTPVTLSYLDGSVERMWLRLYDKPDARVESPEWLTFTLPLVALDPYRYGSVNLSGVVGVFTGQTWYRTYTDDGGVWRRAYTQPGGAWVRSYQQSQPTGPYPTSVAITSDGDAVSRRVVTTVTGPLEAGSWWLINETSGERLWVETGVTTGQQLVLDSQTRTARLNGADVDHLVFGDWLGLHPGMNTFRLVAAVDEGAFAAFDAVPAYQ